MDAILGGGSAIGVDARQVRVVWAISVAVDIQAHAVGGFDHPQQIFERQHPFGLRLNDTHKRQVAIGN